MRLFISYARVDKPLLKQIAERLEDVHEVWYDKRLFAGQHWWEEIESRLTWCEGFVYLLSPESVASEYCQKEFTIAQAQGKHIFPVLIQARTPIPANLSHIHYADVSEGMENIHMLLNAITVAERMNLQSRQPNVIDRAPAAGPAVRVSPPHSTQPSETIGEPNWPDPPQQAQRGPSAVTSGDVSETRGNGRIEFRKRIITDRSVGSARGLVQQFFLAAEYKPAEHGSLAFQRGSTLAAWGFSTDPRKQSKARAETDISMTVAGRTQVTVTVTIAITGQVWMNSDSEYFKAEINDLEATLQTGMVQLSQTSRTREKAQQMGCYASVFIFFFPFLLAAIVGGVIGDGALGVVAFIAGWPLGYTIVKSW